MGMMGIMMVPTSTHKYLPVWLCVIQLEVLCGYGWATWQRSCERVTDLAAGPVGRRRLTGSLVNISDWASRAL